MITVTESTNSFKGVYYHKDTNFTKNQRKTIRQIKSTLGNLQDSRDFYVRQGEKSSVILSSIKKVKTNDTKDSKFKIQSDIGRYDLKHPFRLNDLKEADKERRNRILNGFSLFGVMLLGFLFCLVVNPKLTIGKELNFGKKKTPQIKTELVEKVDTLKNNLIENLK